MIDTLSERINIKELVLPEPKEPEKLPFDPRRDITDDDKKGILGLIGRKMESDANPDAVRHAAQMLTHLKLLRPDTVSTVSLSDENKGKITDNINQNLAKVSSAGTYIIRAWPLHALDPANTTVVGEKLGYDKNVLLSEAQASFLGYLHHLYFYRMSFPDEKIFPNEDKLLRDVENIKKQEDDALKADLTSLLPLKNYIHLLARLRIVAPDKVNEIGINGELAGRGNDVLDALRTSKNYEEFAEYAFYLTILNAKDVTLSSKGLAYTMPIQNLGLDDKTNMPEVRNF